METEANSPPAVGEDEALLEDLEEAMFALLASDKFKHAQSCEKAHTRLRTALADVARGYGGVVQIDAALGSPEWARCAVYLGQTLIGTFCVAPEIGSGEPRRGGSQVEEGKR